MFSLKLTFLGPKKGDGKCRFVKANKLKLASNSNTDFGNQAETWSVGHICVGFLISEVILSVDEGIKDVSSVDQESPHFHFINRPSLLESAVSCWCV